MYCVKCGSEIPDGSEFCSKCGNPVSPSASQNNAYANPQPYAYQYQRPLKSAGLAAVLSFLFTGLGQVYVGKIARGIGFIVCGVVIALVMVSMITIFISSYNAVWIIAIITSIVCIAIWIFNVIDAYKLANEYNDVLQQTGNPPW
ncbi:zinc-ribbon domain-containing protein [Candidatus Methanomassiliicoccus intestinalis]|uniref:zinc-ribbon domain-containing protein n=1 Tax=Candidatus Methanomassiliicoccus intestinalis TaxID=1406512 RepID=UPI0037DCD613